MPLERQTAESISSDPPASDDSRSHRNLSSFTLLTFQAPKHGDMTQRGNFIDFTHAGLSDNSPSHPEAFLEDFCTSTLYAAVVSLR